MVRVPGVLVLSDANEHLTRAWDGASEAAADSAGEAVPLEQAAVKTATMARAATPFTMRIVGGSPTGWCAADCTARGGVLPSDRQPAPAGPRPSSSGRIVTSAGRGRDRAPPHPGRCRG